MQILINPILKGSILCKFFISILILVSLAGCDPGILNKLKVQIGLAPHEELTEKSQLLLNKNNCNDEENRQLVLEMVKEELIKQANIHKDQFVIQPTFTMLSTQEKTELKTFCNARVNYSYPQEIENKTSVNLDIDYMITKNELTNNGYIVTLYNKNLVDLIDLQANYRSKKEDYLHEKLQIKKIDATTKDINGSEILFGTYKDSLLLNDWIEFIGGGVCRQDKSIDSTLCAYKFNKKSYEVTVYTKRANECLFCAKKSEFVSGVHINEL